MQTKIFYTIVLFLVFLSSIHSQKLKKNISDDGLNRTNQNHYFSKFNINNISTFIYNNGNTELSPEHGAGTEFPKGTGKTLVYQSGFLWGGKINGDIHVSGSTFRQGLQGGKILDEGSPQNLENPSVRVFRVRPDYNSANLFSETEDESLSENEIRSQYKMDWEEWPADFGAPFNDIDNDGNYNPDIDIPGVPGADQTLWYVANDFDPVICRTFAGSDPMNIEIQVTIWGYKNTSIPYDNVIFKKYKLINKNGLKVEDMYISQWADPDVGGAGDDFVGCDSLLNLIFSYNSDDNDSKYGNVPAASGYLLLQGPKTIGDINDQATFDDRLILGYKNIPMTTSYFTFNGMNSFNPHGILFLEYYNSFRGRISTTGVPYINPINEKTTMFTLSGDPLKQTGWVDGILHQPGDRQNGFASGPFMMEVGDTQEVIIAEIAAVGKDKLNSVRILKYYTELIKRDNNSNTYPTHLPFANSPNVEKTESRDGILLSWDEENFDQSIEQFDSNGYKFQGYNIYQLYSDIGLKENGKRIATFDIVDGITTINGTVMADDGKPIEGIQQFGSDSGINREFFISKDYINDDELIKGMKYYFGVSAYTYNKDSAINNTESPLTYIEVEYIKDLEGANYGDQIKVTQTKGIGGAVFSTVIRPSVLTGLDYTISFATIDSQTVWNLDRSDGVRILENQTNIKENDPPSIADGLQISVIDHYKDIKRISVVANTNGLIDPPEAGAAEWQGFPVPLDAEGNPLRPTDNQQIGSGRWIFHTGDPDASKGSFDTFLSRSLRNYSINWLIPYDWEMRFTSRGSWALRWFEDDFLVKVPFELWNTGINTPNDPSDDYRLIPYFLSTTGAGGTAATDPDELTWQLDPVDHGGDDGNNDPQTPWIYWIIPPTHDDDSPGTGGYDEYLTQIDTTIVGASGNVSFGGGTEVMARTVLFNWNGDDLSDGEVDPGTQMVPEEGTIFRIETNKSIQPGVDEFTFNSFKVTGVEVDQTIPDIYEISQNYPNPFNPSTVIKYSLPMDGFVKISVFNVLGQKIIDMVNATLKAGNYNFTFDGSKLASGVYIYRIEVNDFVKSKKMILLK